MGMLRTAFLAAIFASALWWIFSAKKFDPESVRGKRIIVTGSSMGIGEELAYQYSKLGARIIITARSETLLRNVAEKCKQFGAQQVEIVPADMANEESRKQIVQVAKEKFGGLDVLILNHVMIDEESALHISHFRKIIEVNFLSYVDVSNQALPLLEESNGSIGVISSIAGRMPFEFYPSYSACKFALEGYFGSLRGKLISKNKHVSISLAFLGAIGTEKMLDYMKSLNSDESSLASIESTSLAILEGVSSNVNNIYHPMDTRIILEVHKISPEFAQILFTYLHKIDGTFNT